MFTDILLAGMSECIGAALIAFGVILLWSCMDNGEDQKRYYIAGIFILILGFIIYSIGEYFNIKIDKEAYGSNAYSLRDRRR